MNPASKLINLLLSFLRNNKGIIKELGFSLSSLAVSALVHFVLRLFLGRYFGAGELGLYTISFTFYSFGTLLAALGIGAALTKFVAQYHQDSTFVKKLATTGFFTSLFSGFVIGAILFVTSNIIANSLFGIPELAGLLKITAISFPFLGIQKMQLGYLNGLRKMHYYAAINIALNSITFLLTLALALTGYGIASAVASFSFATFLVSTITAIYIFKNNIIVRMNFKEYVSNNKLLLSFGGFVVLSGSIGVLHNNTDSLMITYFLTKAEVGYYTVAFTLAQIPFLFSQAVQLLTTPMISFSYNAGKIADTQELIDRTLTWVTTILTPLLFIIFVLGDDIIVLLYGAEFISATTPLKILLCGCLFQVGTSAVGGALASSGHVNAIFKISIVSLVLNVILNGILIPLWGLIGAALATTCANIFNVVFLTYFRDRLMKIMTNKLWFLKPLLISVICVYLFSMLADHVNHYLLTIILTLVLISLLCIPIKTRKG